MLVGIVDVAQWDFICVSIVANVHDHGANEERTLQLGSVSRLCTLVSSVETLCTGLHWS